MRTGVTSAAELSRPPLLAHATELATYLKTLTVSELSKSMHVSNVMAERTHELIAQWQSEKHTLPAIDAFIGDIYSGLQVARLTAADRAYAHKHLYILSGLYGAIRALDGVAPYRLEMGYRLPDAPYNNLYSFWGNRIAEVLPSNQTVINLSAVEYTRAVFPHLSPASVIVTPKFLTVSQKTGEPTFVTVHAKIARGAFAHWLITQRVNRIDNLRQFSELGYQFDASRSTAEQPVFVCQEFGGIGMSVRLTK